MKELPEDWENWFSWLVSCTRGLSQPNCPAIEIGPWYRERLALEPEVDEALMHFLCGWEWPPMSEDVQGMVLVRLAFALFGSSQALGNNRAAPVTDAQKRGTLHGYVIRRWPEHRERYLLDYAVHWPDLQTALKRDSN